MNSVDLSYREIQVLDLLREAKCNKEIASALGISERTVKFHVSNLLAKFGVSKRLELALIAVKEDFKADKLVMMAAQRTRKLEEIAENYKRARQAILDIAKSSVKDIPLVTDEAERKLKQVQ